MGVAEWPANVMLKDFIKEQHRHGNHFGKRWRRSISTTSSQRRVFFWDVLRIMPIRTEIVAPSLCHQSRVSDSGQHAALNLVIGQRTRCFQYSFPSVTTG